MSITARRLPGAAAAAALAIGLTACAAEDDADAGHDEAAHQAVLASYEGLGADSYTMESAMTVDGIDLMDMTSVVDGEAARASQDLYMSAIPEAMGEEFEDDDPETAAMMAMMLADMRTETVVVDGVVYMQFAGGLFEAMAEDFGEDAWFTLELDGGELGDIYRQFGSFDLAEQTELMLSELSDVQETGDGVYTGTLDADSESLGSLLGATGGAANGAEFVDGTEVTVTLDDDELLQSLEMTLPEIEGMTMHLVSEVAEIGGEYDITAPESDNLHTFEEFAAAVQ